MSRQVSKNKNSKSDTDKELSDPISDIDNVYLIQEKETKFYKIGHSTDPIGRMKVFDVGNPHELILIACCPGGLEQEKIFQKRYAKARVKGEWFELDGLQAADIIIEYIKLRAEFDARKMEDNTISEDESESCDEDIETEAPHIRQEKSSKISRTTREKRGIFVEQKTVDKSLCKEELEKQQKLRQKGNLDFKQKFTEIELTKQEKGNADLMEYVKSLMRKANSIKKRRIFYKEKIASTKDPFYIKILTEDLEDGIDEMIAIRSKIYLIESELIESKIYTDSIPLGENLAKLYSITKSTLREI